MGRQSQRPCRGGSGGAEEGVRKEVVGEEVVRPVARQDVTEALPRQESTGSTERKRQGGRQNEE